MFCAFNSKSSSPKIGPPTHWSATLCWLTIKTHQTHSSVSCDLRKWSTIPQSLISERKDHMLYWCPLVFLTGNDNKNFSCAVSCYCKGNAILKSLDNCSNAKYHLHIIYIQRHIIARECTSFFPFTVPSHQSSWLSVWVIITILWPFLEF